VPSPMAPPPATAPRVRTEAVQVVAEPEGLRAAADALRDEGRVALVPTMGALHRGHVALIERARELATSVVVSIFVNPTQFGPREDLDKYPRTLDADLRACEAAGARCVFTPSASAMYLPGESTRVRVSGVSEALCGASRPGHFEGVATVVTKLFALMGPSVAVFGRKDYQQLQVIRRFARDLFLPVEVVGVPTVREPDGLALSSRNVFLTEPERRAALAIPRALGHAAARFEAGERDASRLSKEASEGLASAGLRVDYVTLADPESVVPITSGAVGDRCLLAVAAFAGTTRLIDNLVLGEDAAPRAEPS
jgi:pantoate--beta-alanine ligase